MNILVVTIGNYQVPSSRVRALQYIPYFEKEGIKCHHIQYRKGLYLNYQTYGARTKPMKWAFSKLLSVLLKSFDYLIYSKLSLLHIWCTYTRYDVLLIQKVILPVFLVQKIKNKCKIIFDFDDAIYAKSRSFTLKQFRYQIRSSDITIVTNKEAKRFAERAGGKCIETIIGPIDSERYKSSGDQPENDYFTIGWIGSQTNFHYLDIIKKPLLEFSKNHPGEICLHLIGVEKPLVDGVKTTNSKWDPETEVSILDSIDVGIMPLKDDEFTRGKGAYKLLQYMSMGKANISSPVGVNDAVVIEGHTGLKARSEQEWIDCFELYFSDSELRKIHGTQAREIICDHYSLIRWSAYLVNFIKSMEHGGKHV
jgi:glycosyltransferase involved in cell wall biosynthesis